MLNKDNDTCHLYAQCGWYVTPLLISTCSVLHVRQNSSIYTLVLHTVTTKFVIWLRKWNSKIIWHKKKIDDVSKEVPVF
jgi:hypothetical protein